MSMRAVHTSWFEMLVSHEELTDTMEALASTGCIELEAHERVHPQMNMQDMQLRMQEYARLERYHKSLWPVPDTGMSPFNGSPAEVIDKALGCISEWEHKVRPQLHRLDIVKHRISNLRLLQALFSIEETEALDFSLLTCCEGAITPRLYLQSNDHRIDEIPDTLLWREYASATHKFLLLVGTTEDVSSLSSELMQKKYTAVQFLELPAKRNEASRAVEEKLSQYKMYQHHLHSELERMAKKNHLAQALGEIQNMQWFLKNVPTLSASSNFVWITGWSSDSNGERLLRTMSLQGIRGILHYPDVPEDVSPPLVMKNPWWAKPFELFASMLGTPGSSEADPSRLLALIVPLLFGYMFGDVGQGFVLLILGLSLQKRWPAAGVLVANGVSAMMFGFIFGSMFGREDIIPALWLHPITQPLPVLVVPLVAGAFIILLGLILSALESNWQGKRRHWLLNDAPIFLLYMCIVGSFMLSDSLAVTMPVIAFALLWYVAGNLILSRGKVTALLVALGVLLESMMQLLLNTLSFVRVGAFALAHAGLSMAFNIMADSVSSVFFALLLMLLGNIIVIVLEGLVVSIQTTRLVLFEFFIRFLQANGRVFKPLTRPLRDGPGGYNGVHVDEAVSNVSHS